MPTSDNKAKLTISFVSLFPEVFEAVTHYGVTGRAVRDGVVNTKVINPRDYTHDKHRTVDDRPYGGGPGMLMKVEPLLEALDAAQKWHRTAGADRPAKVIYLSPQGKPLTQYDVDELSKSEHLVLLAGRYEGIDERVIDQRVDAEVSIGDYVLSGGELPAMVLTDAMIRKLPGALGHQGSAQQDSFADGLLDYPHYTRPEELGGKEVPAVLLSGNHREIERWRMQQALGRTWLRRPELLEQLELTDEQKKLLEIFKQNTSNDK